MDFFPTRLVFARGFGVDKYGRPLELEGLGL